MARSADVLVIGSGAAGLSAALAAAATGATVLVATKFGVASSNTAKAQGGIQAAIGADDDVETHAVDVMRSSHDTADPRLVEALCGDGPSVVVWLAGLGVAFTRDADGRFRLARCGGATRRRLLQVGDRTGHAIAKALREAVQGDERIAVRDHAPLRELDHRVGRITARIGDEVVAAGSIVLAAGGRCVTAAAELGELSTNGAGATGEVAVIAREIGCASRDDDSLQRHPTGGVWPDGLQGYAIPETTRAYGALLLNNRGDRFVDELAPRDVVAESIIRECSEGRGLQAPDGRPAVSLDCRPVPAEDAAISLPYMLNRFRRAGIDPLSDPILVYPVLHYQNGGLVIDENGQTTEEGVFAAGEITGGVHGRNRMMGNSLLDCCVFGRRAGRAAALAAGR